MKKLILVLITAICISQISKSQAAKSIYFELGGPGLASFNFDTRFSPKEGGIGGRIGFGGFYVEDVGALFIPIGINYLMGSKKMPL